MKMRYTGAMRINAMAWVLVALLFPALTSAHETYVLSPEAVAMGMAEPRFNIFAILSEPGQLLIFSLIALAAGIAVIVAAFLMRKEIFARLGSLLEEWRRIGFLAMRIAAGLALIF